LMRNASTAIRMSICSKIVGSTCRSKRRRKVRLPLQV
jgi:hypothetical protein